jgi:hypothetical protein
MYGHYPTTHASASLKDVIEDGDLIAPMFVELWSRIQPNFPDV